MAVILEVEEAARLAASTTSTGRVMPGFSHHRLSGQFPQRGSKCGPLGGRIRGHGAG
jgi:hypothetical protein